MTPGEQAELVISELGISEPRDLDVEAIAFDAGMRVTYRAMQGCEASLVGFGGRAIATISPSPHRGRARFSIGHELGHWRMHRGRSFVCRAEDIGANLATDRTLERQADEFASHLLLPSSLLLPAMKGLRAPTFGDIDHLGVQFDSSLLATALRVIRTNSFPAVLACYGPLGLRWQVPSRCVPRLWRLKTRLDPASMAYDLMSDGKETAGASKQSADAWFDNDDADDYEIFEECRPYGPSGCLVLLLLEDGMLDARPDRDLWSQPRKR